MMNRNLLILAGILLAFMTRGYAQHPLLQSGPMLGYSEMREVLLWVQTKAPADVQIEYWESGQPARKWATATARTGAKEAFTAKLIADEVLPGKHYDYRVLINKEVVKLPYPTTFQTQTLWQWRTDPPDFSMALGSCAYINDPQFDRPGTPYGGEYELFTAMHGQRPDAMIWLGDNTYLREADWYTRTGIFHRYTHTRSVPELQPLLASTHHYAIWDDHDYGPDNSDRTFVHKELATETFRLFWGNPTFGLPGQGGTTSFFQWSDVEVFLLDDRYFRTPDELKFGERTMLGQAQLTWLVEALTASKATFKLVAIGGQVLNTAPVAETYSNYFPEERAWLLRRLEEENIKNVVFLTGDRHFTELSKYQNSRGNWVYDLTVSPLTSGVVANPEANNALRVAGTVVTKRNFGILRVTGPRDKRTLRMSIYDAAGQELWSQQITKQE